MNELNTEAFKETLTSKKGVKMNTLAKWGMLPDLLSINQFDAFIKEMDEIMNHAFSNPFVKSTIPYDVVKHTDESGRLISYDIEIPAIKVKKEDIDITVDTEASTINITIGKNDESSNKQYVYHSISSGKKSFTFKFGDNVDVDNISSSIEDGLLTIKIPTIPQKETQESVRKITIN